MKQGATVLATFVYDASGQRVKSTVGTVTTIYIGGIYEYQAGATTKYYEGNAMRRTGYASSNGVYYMLQDHLKSSSVIVNQNGRQRLSRNYYLPFGGNRGAPTGFSGLTTKRFTGQYHEASLPGGEGLSYYGARWYDAKLGRFLSADTIVPGAGNPQAFNRYSYVKNRPLVMVDPTGHYDIKPGDAPYKPPPAKPAIISRPNWSALLPGKFEMCSNGACSTSGLVEGMYNRDTNPGGYAYYSQLLPDKDLQSILFEAVIHHEGNDPSYIGGRRDLCEGELVWDKCYNGEIGNV